MPNATIRRLAPSVRFPPIPDTSRASAFDPLRTQAAGPQPAPMPERLEALSGSEWPR